VGVAFTGCTDATAGADILLGIVVSDTCESDPPLPNNPSYAYLDTPFEKDENALSPALGSILSKKPPDVFVLDVLDVPVPDVA
jgi:hypothetical protein